MPTTTSPSSSKKTLEQEVSELSAFVETPSTKPSRLDISTQCVSLESICRDLSNAEETLRRILYNLYVSPKAEYTYDKVLPIYQRLSKELSPLMGPILNLIYPAEDEIQKIFDSSHGPRIIPTVLDGISRPILSLGPILEAVVKAHSKAPAVTAAQLLEKAQEPQKEPEVLVPTPSSAPVILEGESEDSEEDVADNWLDEDEDEDEEEGDA